MLAILTVSVLLYQLLFVLIMFVASRFGAKTLMVALIACLLWTVTHLFFPPLAVVQSLVIGGSYWWFMKRLRLREARAASTQPAT